MVDGNCSDRVGGGISFLVSNYWGQTMRRGAMCGLLGTNFHTSLYTARRIPVVGRDITTILLPSRTREMIQIPIDHVRRPLKLPRKKTGD